MKAQPDCIACMFTQVSNTIKQFSDDKSVHHETLVRLADWVANASLEITPAEYTQPGFKIISELTGIEDLFKDIRHMQNTTALKIKPLVQDLVNSSDDPLDTALHAAAAGNVIDCGPGHEFDIENDIKEMMHQPFAITALEEFRREVVSGRKLLYLGDNAGEIVFDSILIEYLLKSGMDITFTVKSGPIINDVIMEDAEEVGMTDLVRVIETGSDDIGVNWSNVSDEFRKAFDEADVIISKGHANFETCDERTENVYFLLKSKCEMVAGALSVTKGDIVFKKLH